MAELTLEQKAIRDWKKYPQLAKVFEGVNGYVDFLRADFDSLVNRHMKENSCSRAEAIGATVRAHPELHRQWIAVVNIIGGGT